MLNLLLPKYNKLYKSQNLEQRILDNYDVIEKFERTSTNNTTGSQNVNNTNKNLYSDTPKKRIDIESNDFVTNITKNNGTSSLNTSGVDDGVEKWERTMQGNIGIQTDAMAVTAYENSLRNIDLELFNELEVLFMGVF